MQFLGGDADLGTEAELLAVGEGGRMALTITAAASTCSVNRCAAARSVVTMALGMTGAVGVDVVDGASRPSTTASAMSSERTRLAVPPSVGLSCTVTPARCSAPTSCGSGGIGDGRVDQQRLGGVAHARPAGLGVEHDPLRNVEVGGGVDVHVAAAHAGLDRRHACIPHHRVDQSGSPRGITTSTSPRAWMRWVTLERSALGSNCTASSAALTAQRTAQGGDQFGVELAADELPRSSAALPTEREAEGVDGDIGPAFVDDADHPERHPLLTQLQPVGQGPPRSTSPIGSGSPATCRKPAAMPSIRCGLSASRSNMASEVPRGRSPVPGVGGQNLMV